MKKNILLFLIIISTALFSNDITLKTSFTDSKYEAATSYYLTKKLSMDFRLLYFHQSEFEAASIGFTFPIYQSDSLRLKSSLHYGPSLNQRSKMFFNYYSSLNYTFHDLDFSGLYNYFQLNSIVHKLKLRSSVPFYYTKMVKFLYEIEFKRSKGKTTYETQPIIQFKYSDILIELGSNFNSNYHFLFKYIF